MTGHMHKVRYQCPYCSGRMTKDPTTYRKATKEGFGGLVGVSVDRKEKPKPASDKVITPIVQLVL